jgi:hypothetical protein
MIFEVLVVLAFGIGLRAVFINTSSADSAIQQYMVERLKVKPFGDYTCNKSVIQGIYGYPSLHYYLFTNVPFKHRLKVSKILNIFIDAFIPSISIILYCLTDNVLSGVVTSTTGILLVGLVITSSPILFPLSARLQGMGARVIGLLIFLFLIIGWYYIEINNNSGFIITVIACYLAVSTSMFLVQVILSMIIYSFCFGYIEFPLTCTISFIIMLITNFGGTRDLLQWKIAHSVCYNMVKHMMLVVPKNKSTEKKFSLNISTIFHQFYRFARDTRNATYHIIGPKLLIDNFMALPCIWFYFKLDLRIVNDIGLNISYAVLFGMLITYTLTCLKPLRIFGQPDRYFEYSIICQGYILYFLFINGNVEFNDLILIISVNIFVIGFNFAILFRPIKAKRQYNSNALSKVAQILDTQKRRVLVIPSKLGYELACLTNNCKFWLPLVMEKKWWTADKIGFKYWRDAMDSNYYDQHEDFTHTMNVSKLDTVVISKNDSKKYKLTEFTKLTEFDDYSIYEYKSEYA